MNVFLKVILAESLSFREAFHLEFRRALLLLPATGVNDIYINSADKSKTTVVEVWDNTKGIQDEKKKDDMGKSLL